MTTAKKVSISAILRRVGDVAEKAGISEAAAKQALIDAHEKLGIEVDLSAGTVLDFTKTQPKAPPTMPPAP